MQYNPPKDTERRVLRQVVGLNLPNRRLLRFVSPSGSLMRTSTDSSTTMGIPLGRLPAISHRHGVLPQACSWPMVRDGLVMTLRQLICFYSIYFYMVLLTGLFLPCLYFSSFGSMIKLDIMFNLIKVG